MSKYSKTIEKYSKTIEKYSKTIEKYSKTIEKYSKTIEKYSKTIDLDLELLDKIITCLENNFVIHVNVNNSLHADESDDESDDEYYNYSNILAKFYNKMKYIIRFEYEIYDKTKIAFIIIIFNLSLMQKYNIIFKETEILIDKYLDYIINKLCIFVIKYYIKSDKIVNNNIIFINSYYKYIFIYNFFFLKKYLKYNNYFILFDYLFILNFFNNIKYYCDYYNYNNNDEFNHENNLESINILDKCFYEYAIKSIQYYRTYDSLEFKKTMITKIKIIKNLSEIRFL